MGLSYADATRCGIAHEHPDHPGRKGARADPAPPRPTPPGPHFRRWTARIEGWHPAGLNSLMNGRWTAHKIKKADKATVGKWLAGLPKATGRRRLTMTLTMEHGQRRLDPDNVWKSLNDALKWHGILKTDSELGVELMPVKYDPVRSNVRATTLVIEEIA